MSSRLIARVDLPGVKKDDLKVEVHDTHLTISARREREVELMNEVAYRRSDGVFFRSILLPDGVKVDDIQANFDNGVLEVSAVAPLDGKKRRRNKVDGVDARTRGLRAWRPPMVEIKNILCPIDFSDHSRHALDHAVGLATWYSSSVTVLHVPPMVDPVVGQALHDFVNQDASAAKIETLVQTDMDPADAIVASAKTVAADLIALGTNGHSGSPPSGLGSVAEKVLRLASRPVLNVPLRQVANVPLGPIGFRRIICPIDFSDSSRGALDFAAALARDANARLTIVHVVELNSEVAAVAPDFDAHREARLEPARRSLRESISPTVREWSAVEELLQMGTPHDEILHLADEQDAGLIVMGVRGKGGDRGRLGSTIRGVASAANCPVLAVP